MGIASLISKLTPAGALIAGFGADLIGPHPITIILSKIAGTIAVFVFLFSATVRKYRLSLRIGDRDERRMKERD
jgi:hypothetical protein